MGLRSVGRGRGRDGGWLVGWSKKKWGGIGWGRGVDGKWGERVRVGKERHWVIVGALGVGGGVGGRGEGWVGVRGGTKRQAFI